MLKSKKILILVDNARRDILSCYLLKNSLVKLGASVVFSNKRSILLDLVQHMPDGVVISRADYPFVAKLKTLTAIFIYPGEGGRLTPESALGPYIGYNKESLYDMSFISRAYIWGERVKHWLLETGFFKPEQLLVVGNNKLDPYIKKKYDKTSRKSKDFVLGVAITAKATSTYEGVQNYVRAYHEFNKVTNTRYMVLKEGRHMEEFVWRDHGMLRLFVSTLKKYMDQTDGKVSIRVGPFEDVSHYKFLEKEYTGRVVVENDEMSAPEWIHKVDAVLTCWSTLCLEVLASKKPVISMAYMLDNEHLFNCFIPEANGFNDIIPCYHTPKTIDEAIEMIQKASKGELYYTPNEQKFSKFMKEVFNWPSGEFASEKIAQDIVQKLQSTNKILKSRKTWASELNSKTLNICIQPLVPIYISLILAKVANSIRYFIKDLRSDNFRGNRMHHSLENRKLLDYFKKSGFDKA